MRTLEPRHGGSDANALLTLEADDRDENGGCHAYYVRPTMDDDPDLCLLRFQKGPLKEAGLNGITEEVLLTVLIDRLDGFNSGPYRCKENACAKNHLEEALLWLNERTRQRKARGVEGTSQV